MAEHIVGSGGFPTLAAALAKAKPGDTVRVLPGTYKESIKIATTGLTLVGEPGAVLDGGYSHEWAKTKGSSWRDLQYKAPPAGSKDMIIVAADGVTLDGLSIRNAPDSGVAAGAVEGLTVRNCRFDHIYGTAVKVNGTTGKARKIIVEGLLINVVSVRIFDKSRTHSDPQGVSGAMKFGNCEDVVVRNCQVLRSFGEGINVDKGAVNVTVSGCTVVDPNHKGIYINRSKKVRIINNIVAFTADPGHGWIKASHPAGIGVNDETARGNYGDSSDITIEGNLVIDAGILLQINGDDPQGVFTVRGNTFIWGPHSRKGVQIGGPYKGEVTGNLFHVTPGAVVTTGNPAGLAWGGNRWSIAPPTKWRGEGDVYGPLGLKAPEVMPTAEHDGYGMGDWVSIDVTNYRVTGQEPPEEPEPPVEPEPDPNEDIIREVLKRFAALEAHVDGILSAATEASRTIRDLTEFVEGES